MCVLAMMGTNDEKKFENMQGGGAAGAFSGIAEIPANHRSAQAPRPKGAADDYYQLEKRHCVRISAGCDKPAADGTFSPRHAVIVTGCA